MALIQNKLVVWDWNGTLVDDSFVFVDIMNSFLSSYSLKTISLKNYRDYFCFPVKKYYSSLGFQLTEEEFETLSINFIKQYKKKMFKPLLKTNILSVLNYIESSGCSQIIISAQEQGLLNKSIAHYGLKKYFSKALGLTNNLAVSKAALAKKAVSPFIKKGGKVLFVGDTLHDLEVARFVGASCCLVSWGHNSVRRFSNKKADVVFSVSDLSSFIKNFIMY